MYAIVQDGGKQYNKSYTIPNKVTSVTGTTSGTIVFQIKFRKWKSSILES